MECFFFNFYWGFSAIDTFVNDAIAQLMVATPEKRLTMLILPIRLSIGGVFFSVKIQCVT